MGFSADSTHRLLRYLVLVAAALWLTVPATAHVGSPDIYADGSAGPYRLFVTVRPPTVIPGVAEIDVRAIPDAGSGAVVSGIQIAPIPLIGEASKRPPVADAMKPAAGDPNYFTGALWIMAPGSWQVRFTVNGNRGAGVLSIPVPATSTATRGMQTGLGIVLGSLGLLLVAGVIGIVGAAVRDAQLPPGATPVSSSRKRAWIAMSVTLVLLIAALWFGNWWWSDEASSYAKSIYKPLEMQATLQPGNVLDLRIHDPGWLNAHRVGNYVLDHDHLMHLYMLREPGLELIYHLHPDQAASDDFRLPLPSMPAGTYKLYADVVHSNGFPETLVARITLPEIVGRALSGDDAKGTAPALSPLRPSTAGCPTPPEAGPHFHLPDGYTMSWNNAGVLPAKTPQSFEFTLLDAKGKPPGDMALYMGMVGHAAFVKEDGTVFAHLHPSGTISMAALMMAAAQNQPNANSPAASATMASMPGMASATAAASTVPNTVGFPYGFPSAGAYRIFVQMKHGSTIDTAAFDACAAPAKPN